MKFIYPSRVLSEALFFYELFNYFNTPGSLLWNLSRSWYRSYEIIQSLFPSTCLLEFRLLLKS